MKSSGLLVINCHKTVNCILSLLFEFSYTCRASTVILSLYKPKPIWKIFIPLESTVWLVSVDYNAIANLFTSLFQVF